MIRPGDRCAVRKTPRDLDIGLLRPSAQGLLEVWIVHGPHADLGFRIGPEHAAHLGERQDAIVPGRKVMKDRNAQRRVEGRVWKREGRRVRPDPRDRAELPRRSGRLPADREESSREVDSDHAMAGQGQRPGMPTVSTAHIEDEAARGKVGDEVEHAVPRLYARRCVGLRNPVVRRADIRSRATHTRMREWVPNKGWVTVPGRLVPCRASLALESPGGWAVSLRGDPEPSTPCTR